MKTFLLILAVLGVSAGVTFSLDSLAVHFGLGTRGAAAIACEGGPEGMGMKPATYGHHEFTPAALPCGDGGGAACGGSMGVAVMAMSRDEDGHGAGHRDKAEAEGKAVDPVCGMTVDRSKVKYVHEYEGEKYYFCMKQDYLDFKADPGKYLEQGEK